MEDINIQISDLESQIASLPVGYISKKMINGKERYYQQWTENGKIKSKYIKNEEVEEFQKKIEFRKSLQSKLSELKSSAAFIETPSIKDAKFNLRIMYGTDLKDFASQTKDFQKRDCFTQIQEYLYSNTLDKVCLVYGLRRTGKTTMIRQCLYEMKEGDFKRSVYIKATVTDTMAALNKDLKQLRELGIKYVFIDEVTLISDFIDSAAILSDIYSAMGMKIVLSVTDSLGFWLAVHEELYDRAVMVHTTYIPFSEHSRLLGINDVDEYIRYGGTMSLSGINYNEHSIFSNKESTDAYVDSAIAKNIQHSLKYYQNAGHFRHLEDCYEKNELTSVINRVVEDINHRFTLSVLIDDFVSHDLGLSARNLLRAWCAFARSVMRAFALSHSRTFTLSAFSRLRFRTGLFACANYHVREFIWRN